jgi:putative endonuclease
MLSSRHRVLYVGVSGDLKARVCQHKHKLVRGFTSKYNVDRLVWYEVYEDPMTAIGREKQLKRWSRAKKTWLIETLNPEWRDLCDEI